MLLARRGYRVLVVDRASFPSDTLSTHFIHPPGVAALDRWGLLDAVTATGCPPVAQYSFDFGPVQIAGAPRPSDGQAQGYAPRRTVLDKILVDAADEAGAEIREQFTVDEILTDDGAVVGIRGHERGGASVTERARVVVGADGRHSTVARAVDPPRYNERPALQGSYYTYWSEFPANGFEIYLRPPHGWGVLPTNDGLTLIVVGNAIAHFDAFRRDVERSYLETVATVPEFAARIARANREERFAGTSDLPNYFRKPFGAGWALVGDAGYHKDPITAFGITDAFHDAERLVDALDLWQSGALPYDEAMTEYQSQRDVNALPMYDLTCQIATLEPPNQEMQQLFGAMHGNQSAMDDFVSVMAGTLPPPEFFNPDNIGRIVATAASR
jgi:2-polyprenyl-6-methoxyphenol hydroxylase-like FAD-dependent oxidoreductase